MDLPFLATIRKPLLALLLFDCCVSSVKKYLLGTLKCHDYDIFKLQQPIRLQHFERGSQYCNSDWCGEIERQEIRIRLSLLASLTKDISTGARLVFDSCKTK